MEMKCSTFSPTVPVTLALVEVANNRFVGLSHRMPQSVTKTQETGIGVTQPHEYAYDNVQ